MTQQWPVSGWFPDPTDPSRQRYFDGKVWTDNYAPYAAPQPPLNVAVNPVESRPSKPSGITAPKFVLGAVVVIFLGVVIAAITDGNHGSSEPTDELGLPSVRDGKLEFKLLTWDGNSGQMAVMNIGDRSWSYRGENQKAVDAQGREFDCEGGSARDIQPGGGLIDSITCLNGDVPIHHLEVHDSWLSLGTDIVLKPAP